MYHAPERKSSDPRVAFFRENVPPELRAIRRWIVWAPRDKGDGKFDKVPTNPVTLAAGNKHAEELHLTFDEACEVADRHGLGIGIVLDPVDGIVATDWDRCLEDGVITGPASEFVPKLATYTEVSPSGRGLRCFTFGAISSQGPFPGGELYNRWFLTVTGRVFGEPAPITPNQRVLDEIQKLRLKEVSRASLPGAQLREGGRNSGLYRALLSASGQESLRAAGVDGLGQFAEAYNASRCDPPLPSFEVARIVKSALASRVLRSVVEAQEHVTENGLSSDLKFLDTDEGLARELAVDHAGKLLFTRETRAWYRYDGRRWTRNGAEEFMATLAEATVVRLCGALGAAGGDQALTTALTRTIRRLRDTDQTRKAWTAAQRFFSISEAELDAETRLLNCENGTIDLKTGELLEHSPADLLTKLAPVEFRVTSAGDPGHDVLERFLNGVCWSEERGEVDEELKRFVQRAVGYTLLGTNPLELFFCAYGPKASGKSTLLHAILSMLGDYGETIDFSTLAESKNGEKVGGARPDLLRMKGRRIAAIPEVGTQVLSSRLVKTLTGRDTITARDLYCGADGFVTFTPTAVFWLASNEAPRLPAGDDAVWRRAVRVPLIRTIPEEERDPAVKSALTGGDRDAMTALFSWAVEGALHFADPGARLDPPASVVELTDEMRGELNPLKDWLADFTIDDPMAVASVSEVTRWVNVDLRRDYSTRTIGALLRQAGVRVEVVSRKSGSRVYGIRHEGRL